MPNILIVEDSPTQAEQLRLLLEKGKYEVETAGDGSRALEALGRRVPDAVITDIVMPGMDGFQLCRTIKADPRLRDVPVIILTSLSDPVDVIRGLECGANCFVPKPYNEAELFARLQQVLLNKEMRRPGGAELAVEFVFMGRKHKITSDRMQILDLLITTYETAVSKNRELLQVQEELRALNQRLEEEVRQRTASLRLEMEERRRVEAEKERFFALSPDMFCIAGFDGFFKQVNPAWEKTLGFTLDELKSKPFLEFVHPEDRERTTAESRRLTEGGEAVAFENRYLCADGSFRWLLWTVAAVPAERLLFAVAKDMTDRNKLREQLLQAQKMETVGQLAAGVAHDFNNLITAITGYSELLLRELPPEDSKRADVEEIKRAGQRAAALTRQLLAFGRRQLFHRRLLDLNGIVAELESMLRRVLGEHIDLACRLRPGLGAVMADPGGVEQVIVNLAVNARDAMPRGGRLTIETAEVELDAAYAASHAGVTPGPHVVLAVSDTGTGMDAATQARIFEPFFTTKPPGKGTGLGLSTVHGIVKQSGGHVFVYSEPGKGTTFKVYLPREKGAVEVPERRGEGGRPLKGIETVMLVEDEEAVRALASRVLKEAGYTVIEARNGEEALAVNASHRGPLHLVLTDVVMPEVGGRELVVRLALTRPGLKALFMSGYTNDGILRMGALSEGIPYIEKPFTTQGLLEKVRQVLDAPDTMTMAGGSPG